MIYEFIVFRSLLSHIFTAAMAPNDTPQLLYDFAYEVADMKYWTKKEWQHW